MPIAEAEKDRIFIKESYASSKATAYLMMQKYVMASPLYRLEQEIKSNKVLLSRQTMSNWIMKAEMNI